MQARRLGGAARDTAGRVQDLAARPRRLVTDESDQTRELFDDEYYVLHQGRRTPEGVGCSIVSRWPPVRVDEIDLCVTERVDPQDFPGRSTMAEFDTPVGAVLSVNHKPNWQITYERERELQAVTAAAAIEKLTAGPELHVVLAGDFDARPETASVRFWTGRQSLGDQRGPTLSIRSAGRLFDQPVDGHFGTDHFGVTADLEQP